MTKYKVSVKIEKMEKIIGIIVALHKEAENVITKTNANIEPAKNGKKIFTGTIKSHRFVLIESGIGKVNAALSAQYLIDNFPIDYIINFGSVGGISGKTETLEFYRVEKCCQYDFDLSAIDNVSVGYIQDYDSVYFYPNTDKLSFLKPANLATSDRFTEKQTDVDTVSDLGCNIFDMEGGAIAQVCTANNIPFYMFKGVTDIHGSWNDEKTFYRNLKAVCNGFYDILIKIFD